MRALNAKTRVHELNAQTRRLSAKNSDLKERVEELSKYELQFDEEPDVTDEDALNVRHSYEFARSRPRNFDLLTGETPDTFDDLYKIVALPLHGVHTSSSDGWS